MASQGKGSRNKGRAFEQKIARDLREIFDGPQWCAHHETLTPRQQRAHLKSSKVRRGEQGKGAREADIVVSGRPWWFELQDVAGAAFNPEKKLAQAERDIQESEAGLRYPISICHRTNERTIWCAMRLGTLTALADIAPSRSLPKELAATIVRIPYDALLLFLEREERP